MVVLRLLGLTRHSANQLCTIARITEYVAFSYVPDAASAEVTYLEGLQHRSRKQSELDAALSVLTSLSVQFLSSTNWLHEGRKVEMDGQTRCESRVSWRFQNSSNSLRLSLCSATLKPKLRLQKEVRRTHARYLPPNHTFRAGA